MGKLQFAKYSLLMKQSPTGCSGAATANECGCCPPGLVSVFDAEGCHAGCLTPADAVLYNKYTTPCKQGYIKYFAVGGAFLGCVEEEELLTILKSQNP